MAIVGAHVLLYSPQAEELRTALREALGWPYVEAHDPPDGWQIFRLPQAELGVHPSEGETKHELSLICDDLGATVAELQGKGLEIRGEPVEEEWGVWVVLVLPGGVEVRVYEARHRTAI